MALAIHLSTFVDAGYTGSVMRWILKQAVSGVEVDRVERPGPHGVVYSFSFDNNIQDIVYRVELYEVPPLATVGNLIKAHDLTVTTSTIRMDADIEIIVGRGTDVDPDADTDTGPIIPDIIGRNGHLIHRLDGQLLREREPEWDKALALSVGRLKLLNGRLYDDSDIYIWKFDVELVINPPGSVNPGPYSSVEIITADRTVLSSDARKLFICRQPGKVMNIQLPVVTSFPEELPLYIDNTSDEPTSINLVVKAFGSDTILNNSFNETRFIFSRGESGYIIRKGNQWYGFNNSPDARYRGKVEFCNYTFMNREYADGREVNADDYPGIDQALSRFPAGKVLSSLAFWNTAEVESIYTRYDKFGNKVGVGSRTVYPYRSLFAKYQVAGVWKIRFPDYRKTFMRAIDTSFGDNDDLERRGNYPGGWQSSSVVSHSHYYVHGGRGGVDDNPNGGAWGIINSEFTEVSLESFGGGADRVRGGETRPDNIGQIACVIL